MLHVKNLAKVYRSGETETRALNGVDLDIKTGEIVVALGPSGSGKTTLLNICGGLDTGTSGQVIWEGQDISGLGQKELTAFRRAHIGFVFQGYNLLPSLTALENVETGARLSPEKTQPLELLKTVMLEDKARKFPYQLSGGEQQRVSIARAVAKNPKLLLCDEPTGALDEKTGKAVLALLQKLNRERGTTIFIITHNANIARIAHKALRMNSGRIVDVSVNTQVCDAADIGWA
jgi:putative ABC transport system ATP-binding protein